MKKYKVNNNIQAYNLIGNQLEPVQGIFIQEGGSFNGELVFLKMPYGFQPMVKVIDDRVYPTTYYFTNSVNQINENYASANGDFWKGLLSSGIKTVQQQHLDKKEYSEAEIQQVYKESGAKKTFAEWFNSPEGKNTLNDVLNLTTSILDKDKNIATQLPEKKAEEEKPETTILWMHPLTFGVVAIVSLVSAIILIPMFTKKKAVSGV